MKIYRKSSLKKSMFVLMLLMFSTPIQAQDILKAAGDGDLAKVKELLEKNPGFINTVDEESCTLMHYAAYGGHIEIVKYLFEKGMELTMKSISDETPLHYAAVGGHTDVIKFLIQKRVNLDAQPTIYYAPLHYAIMFGKGEAAKLLIENGADKNIKNGDGNTPLDLAIENKKDNITAILREKGAVETEIPDFEISKYYGNIRRITLPYSGRPNVSVSVGDEGVLLLDSGYLRTAEKLKTTIKNLKKGKLQYIINTHMHFDHNGGNGILGDGIRIINLDNLEKMVSDGVIKKSNSALRGNSGMKFDTYYTMRFNGEEIRLIPANGIHTDKDMLIHFIGSNVMVMGDLLLPDSFPSIRGEVAGDYLNFLDKVIDVFPGVNVFIAGHGHDKTIDDVKNYRKMLIETAEIVKNSMKAGKSKAEIKKERLWESYNKIYNYIPELNTNYWIEAVYRFYKDK